MFPACDVMYGNFQKVVEESYRGSGFVLNSQGGWELPPAADLGDDDDAGAEDDETTEERYPGFDWDNAPFDKDSPEIIPPPVGLSKHTVINDVALHVPESPQVMSQSSSFGALTAMARKGLTQNYELGRVKVEIFSFGSEFSFSPRAYFSVWECASLQAEKAS